MALGWQLYASDHEGKYVNNHGRDQTRDQRNNWANNVLDWNNSSDNTNRLALLNKNTIITNNRDEQTIEFSEIKQRINSEKNTNE